MPDVRLGADERCLREKISAQSANADDYEELAKLLFRSERYEESIDILRQAVSMGSSSVTQASVLGTLGWYIYAATGTIVEPRALGEQALRITEGVETEEAAAVRANAKYLLAELCIRNDPDLAREMAVSALATFERLLEARDPLEPPQRRAYLSAAASLNSLLDRFDVALNLSIQAFGAASDSFDKLSSLLDLGTAYRNAGQLNEARRVFTEIIHDQQLTSTTLFRPYYELARIEREMGKHAEARAKVRRALEILHANPSLSPDRLPELLSLYGQISYDLEDMEQAARSFQMAVDKYPATDPYHWNALLGLAYSQYALGQNEAASKNGATIKDSLIASEEDRAKANELVQAIRTDM